MSQALNDQLKSIVQQFFATQLEVAVDAVEFQATRKEFEGDITIVVFPLLRFVKMKPEVLGTRLGDFLVETSEEVESFNVVKGFLNLVLSDAHYLRTFEEIYEDADFGITKVTATAPVVMVEFSSPNTNKPLHLGHIRNNLLGYSVAKILEATGKNVIKTQIINDRGIHICKSMVAWQLFGAGETPESTGLKGDQLVGKYYVKFDQEYKKEIAQLVKEGTSEAEAAKIAPLLLKAQSLLLQWEANDPETRMLWEKMNGWVYEGFSQTYKRLGVDFNSYYYESETYLLGKEIIETGLAQHIFYKKEDG